MAPKSNSILNITHSQNILYLTQLPYNGKRYLKNILGAYLISTQFKDAEILNGDNKSSFTPRRLDGFYGLNSPKKYTQYQKYKTS